MEKQRKMDLIQRSLGIRHKLKVHESMKMPETHEEIAQMLVAKWELEDELGAIEEILADDRAAGVKVKKTQILKGEFKKPKSLKKSQ